MSYYQFSDDNGNVYGSVEILHYSEAEILNDWAVSRDGETGEPDAWQVPSECPGDYVTDNPAELAGYYWRACFPGCLPDGDLMGPFKTEGEAIDDAGAV